MTHIALVQSDPERARQLGAWLESDGHACTVYSAAADFTGAFYNGSHEMVALDWALADASGLEVLRYVRESADWYLPVVMLVPNGAEARGVQALRAGADDFVTYAVSPALWSARVAALLRRALEDRQALQVGSYRVDRASRTISREGKPVCLTDKEFQLAALLLANPGQLMTREYLLETVWGEDAAAATRTVDTHASRVRHKLGLTRRGEFWLRPVYGRGYELVRNAGLGRDGGGSAQTNLPNAALGTLRTPAPRLESRGVGALTHCRWS